MSNFETELQHLLNKYSKENASDTPDYILSAYMVACLEAYNTALRARNGWYRQPSSAPTDFPRGT